MPPAGRRPGPESTSNDVLAAARALFADRGYRATTIRAIAAAAGVTPGMVHHFFGTKRAVFLAALHMPIDPAAVLDEILAAPNEQFPSLFVRAFITAWQSEATGPQLQTMLRAAISDEQQAAAIRGFAATVVIPRVAGGLDLPVERVAAAMSIMIGLVVTRTMLGITALAQLDADHLVALYTPAVRTALRR